MTKSHGHQRIALFDGLMKRSREKKPSMTLYAMELAYGFESAEQVQHALDTLVESQHLTIAFNGRYPTVRFWKGRFKTTRILERPHCLFPPDPVIAEQAAAEDASPPTVRDPETVIAPVEPTLQLLLDDTGLIVGALESDPGPADIMLAADASDFSIPLILPAAVDAWLYGILAHTDEGITAARLCARIIEAEMDRDRAARLRVPGRLVTAAILRGAPIESYIVNLACERLDQIAEGVRA
jgi:hypothetical protein